MTTPWMTQLSNFNWFRTSLALQVNNSLSSLIEFTEFRPVWLLLTFKLLKIYLSDHAKTSPFNYCARGTIIDKIRAKYNLTDSGACGNIDTPAFKAENSQLAHLMAHMSDLCRHLNLPMPKDLHRLPHFKCSKF